MRWSWHKVLLVVALAGGIGAAGLLAHPGKRANATLEREPARWFIPGNLGVERGAPPPSVGPEAYLTRGLYRMRQGEAGEWARLNQLNDHPVIGHSLHRMVRPEMFESQPELFPEVAGVRWQPPMEKGHGNWNPDLGEEATAEAVAAFIVEQQESFPPDQFISIGTNDSFHYGDSAAVRKWTYPPRWFRGNPDYSDLVFHFSNRVAHHLEKELPDRHVSQLAYYWTELPPRFPVHPKVVPILATDQSQLYDPLYRQQEWMLLSGWGASGAERIGHWHYLMGSGFLIPRIHIGMLAEYYPRARREGFTDFFAMTSFNWGLDGPQPWIAARLLVDPFGNVESWLDEYYRRYFRQAARPMRRFFERCEDIWASQPGPPYWLKHYTNESQIDLFPPEVCRELRDLLNEAARLALGDRKTAARVELTSEAFSVVEAFSRFHHARLALSEALMDGWEISDPAGLEERLVAYQSARQGDLWQESPPSGDEPARAHSFGQVRGGPAGKTVRVFRRYPEAGGVAPPWRGGFLPVLERVRRDHPWAIGRVLLPHFTVNNPGPTARALLAEPPPGSERPHDLQWNEPRSGGLVMSGLDFQAEAPPGWQSLIEPFEGGNFHWSDLPEGTRLRLESQKQFDLYRWVHRASQPGQWAEVEVRGKLSPSAFFMLRANWFDADGTPLGESIGVRLHGGSHPHWRPLRLFLDAPEGAVWLRYRLTAYFMQAGDWLEIQRASLR